MIYALNLFNLIPGKENDYRDYSVKAGRIIFGLGGRVVSAGAGPLREMHGDTIRRQLIVVEFPSLEVFEQFIDEAESQNITPPWNSTTDTSGPSTSRRIWQWVRRGA
jgi:uncharacterized protein (DUF1330 family)